MTTSIPDRVEMIPLDAIHVLNPRARNRKQHQEIIENIRLIGLKRPITVCRRGASGGRPQFDLVCGQGRLEAFRALGQREIPALVTEATQHECLLKSLVENIARRHQSSIEQLQEVARLRARGHSTNSIANRLGVSAQWIQMILGLMDHGERRLLRGVESGTIPLSLAVDISKSSDSDIQNLLTDAYTKGVLRGKKLAAVRRLLEQRHKSRRDDNLSGELRKRTPKRPQMEDLRRLYETEAEKHRILIKKADFVQQKLLVIVTALKELFSSHPEFLQILQEEGLDSLPRQLDMRIHWRAHP